MPTHSRDRWNGARYRPGDAGGHYESWFQRANDPTGRWAFWIRYTIFAPAGRPDDAVGELWAIVFDRDRATSSGIIAVKDVVPLDECTFASDRLDVSIGSAKLDDAHLAGSASANGHTIAWDLQMAGGQSPLLVLPERLYALPLPRAKLLVGRPNARFTGSVTVDGTPIAIAGWVGSQNHNWGSRHTDRYAWGQVCGFDEDPDAFLECSTARLKLGPIWSPWMSPIVIRRRRPGGAPIETIKLNNLWTAIRANGAYDASKRDWTIESKGYRIRIEAPPSAFVALRYPNPPGGAKICLNSKIARCELTFPTGERLTSNRAAFEILEDRADLTPEV